MSIDNDRSLINSIIIKIGYMHINYSMEVSADYLKDSCYDLTAIFSDNWGGSDDCKVFSL